MITDEVIKEIYKKFKKSGQPREKLNLDYYIDLLSKHHNITSDDMEIVIRDLEEFNPFRRFLIRSLTAVLEFDKNIAFVFRNHILFMALETPDIRVHIKPEEPKSLLGRIFGRDN